MAEGWIDFKAVKAAARFEPLVERYGLALQPKGQELVGRCPFHEDRRPSFRINLEKRVFHCFGCGAKGNVLDFVARKEGVTIREAAGRVAEWQGLETGKAPVLAKGEIATPPVRRAPRGAERPAGRDRVAQTAQDTPEPAKGSDEDATAPGEPNAPRGAEGLRPLTFTLKLDPEHPYLAVRRVSPAARAAFGIGYCSRGLMKGRVCVPIHDAGGNLVAYLGRWPGEPPEGTERWLLPAGFKKNLVLFNLHRVKGADPIAIVEGVWGVLRLHELGIPAVALLGRTMSEEQEELLAASSTRRLALVLDGDGSGREAAAELLPRLARRFYVRVIGLPDGEQPDTAPEEGLRRDLLSSVLS